ncbi:hypothetical protein Ctha_0282 [Chloroherpeton thalassium ATCC 35110]|uniref:Uncharacterized protein n=1 Tax=Chloroherpeton thalassium (strain ATCC 35110 / GB-78) TaxID=517418 RepID=B3QTK7_CHLT3|nr:hypothetical protein [Chloroherpeton thalassium]ACF12753.1 hypothetical protein Ctha_0282 [Chloroherpeton thalassium ATCC 35110]
MMDNKIWKRMGYARAVFDVFVLVAHSDEPLAACDRVVATAQGLRTEMRIATISVLTGEENFNEINYQEKLAADFAKHFSGVRIVQRKGREHAV